MNALNTNAAHYDTWAQSYYPALTLSPSFISSLSLSLSLFQVSIPSLSLSLPPMATSVSPFLSLPHLSQPTKKANLSSSLLPPLSILTPSALKNHSLLRPPRPLAVRAMAPPKPGGKAKKGKIITSSQLFLKVVVTSFLV